jgi:S-DNA-T family DNA segregation ATPase FtsK/SpoIIIE
LYTNGNDALLGAMCFYRYPEVERLLISLIPKAHATTYLLPEFVGEDSGINLDIDISERDTLFREAAEIIVKCTTGISIFTTKET